jgi:hypothetical protein
MISITKRYIANYTACGNVCSAKRNVTLDGYVLPLDLGLPLGRLLCVIGRVKSHCAISMFTTQRAEPSWT